MQSVTHRAPELVAHESWVMESDPMALANIFSPSTSIAIWQRAASPEIQAYFDAIFADLNNGLCRSFDICDMRQELLQVLPEAPGKADAAEDIFLLADMLTCLFNCNGVGLRLAPLTSAMCPKFHIDNIQVRLVNTYLGGGTQWLPRELVDPNLLGHKSVGKSDSQLYDAQHIQQLDAFDVALLKGSAWDNQNDMAAVHRSCPVAKEEKRVLLTLDPM